MDHANPANRIGWSDFRSLVEGEPGFFVIPQWPRKNNLYQNFLDHKRRQGHWIKVVDFNLNMHFAGEEYLKRGWGRAVNIRRKAIIDGPLFDW